MKHYLNDVELEKVIAFNEDEVMKEAVRKVLLEGIYEVGVLKPGEAADGRNWAFNLAGLNDMAMDDDKVGSLLKATAKGIGALEDGFKRIAEFKHAESESTADVNIAE